MIFLLIVTLLTNTSIPMSFLARQVETDHSEDYSVQLIQPLWGSQIELVSSSFDLESGCFVFTWRVQPSYLQTIPQTTPKPDPIYWREYFGVEDGTIRLIKTIVGEYIPATSTPSSVDWGE